MSGLQLQSHPDFGRLRMFNHVVDRFLEGEKNVMADFRWNGDRRQLGRHLGAVTQSGQREVFLRIFADVIDQAFQRVVGRIDRPDDFVEGTGRFARGLGNLLRV